MPAFLRKPRFVHTAIALLLLIHTGLLAYSAYVHSPTLNEPGHLVAGLSYWKFGRFDVYSVNPPLVRLVAALPVMAAGYNEDWSAFYSGPGARPEFDMGEDFVAANGERSFFLFMIARWACIPFSWVGAIVCYLWARDLYGQLAGLLACAIWCFEPNILAHAALITSDAAGTAVGLAACYTFWRWLKRPTWSQAALTGVILGLAELCKSTLIVFFPLWPLMWFVYRWTERRTMVAMDWAREAGMLALRMAIGIYVLNFGYAFEGSSTQLKDFQFVSNLFTGQAKNLPPSQGGASGRSRPQPLAPSPPSNNRFANSWLGELPVPLPKNYVLGIDLQRKDFEDYERPSYLRGEWRDQGWWYYYLYAAAIKVPLGVWTLGILALVMRVIHLIPSSIEGGTGWGQLRDEFILLFPAIVIFALVSSQTGFNEHFRYVLPSFPYFFIWSSQAIKIFEKTD
jgi:4-amino-4-deoxy-L-arabinose transferase-like glycosyltransferase